MNHILIVRLQPTSKTWEVTEPTRGQPLGSASGALDGALEQVLRFATAQNAANRELDEPDGWRADLRSSQLTRVRPRSLNST